MSKLFDLSFYLVLDPGLCAGFGLAETARAAALNGATMIQLRDKQADTAALVRAGLALRQALTGTNALLIINDDVEAAIAMGADGLHLGQDDAAIALARQRIGQDMILGLSVESEALAAAINPDLVDYAGIGPVFATPTKPDHKHPIGMAGLARLVAASPVPSVAIGGLKAGHVAEVFRARAHGVAVVSAVCGTPDPALAAKTIAQAIAEAR